MVFMCASVHLTFLVISSSILRILVQGRDRGYTVYSSLLNKKGFPWVQEGDILLLHPEIYNRFYERLDRVDT